MAEENLHIRYIPYEYVWKNLYNTSGGRKWDGSIATLQNMELNPSIPDRRNPVLVQMWFRETEGKVYTFCLYHVSDYNYMLNVVRLEGKEVKEGEKYIY